MCLTVHLYALNILSYCYAFGYEKDKKIYNIIYFSLPQDSINTCIYTIYMYILKMLMYKINMYINTIFASLLIDVVVVILFLNKI